MSKYWVCKRSPAHAIEALECLGGNGYVEESGMPRLYRDAPLNSIWEGSGNVAALDVLRALAREPEALPALLEEVELAAGAQPRARRPRHRAQAAHRRARARGAAVRRAAHRRGPRARTAGLAARAPRPRGRLRRLLRRRLGGEGGRAFGTLPAGADATAIVERALAA